MCTAIVLLLLCADTAYVLSYAIIMLHTSIYNPSVRDKPTVDSFVRMNRGINNGSDLPRDFLEVTNITHVVPLTNHVANTDRTCMSK